jgi:lipoprotein-anchoring transpeptidase ErfK/SrfK
MGWGTGPNPAPVYRPQATGIARQVVSFGGRHAPGTVVVSTSERRLYFVLGNGQAIQYGVGVGRPGFTWAGTMSVSMKREWPDWRPPAQMLRRRPDLPRHMKGGPDNPLGARALYLGSSIYRIHGSNEPETIGQAVSSGCIRMTNEDVTDLYQRVRVGARVVVMR